MAGEKSRVNITYDLNDSAGTKKVELPFVVGVVGNLSGSQKNKPELADRNFLTVSKDNVNNVMAFIKPELSFEVANKIQKDGTNFKVDLSFNSLQDFEPQNLVKQIPPLDELMQIRQNLKAIMSKANRSAELEKFLQSLLSKKIKLSHKSGK